MNLKVKAGVQTLAFFVGMLAISYGGTLFGQLLTNAQVGVLLISIAMAFLCYVIYSVILGQLEYNEKVKELTDKE